jgi:FdhD protein
MEIEDGISKMRVWLDGEYSERFAALSPSQSSSCGGGTFNTRLFGTMRPLYRPYDLDLGQLKSLARAMVERAEMYKTHGGVHCALLAERKSGRILVSREDIGRNNAIDKVVGWGLGEGVDFAGILLLVTGRVSSDMILKCYRAGISTMVSLTTATSLAFDIALRTDLTLICHVLKPKPILINF